MSAPVVIGVDNGGTWIRMIGLDNAGRCVWIFKRPAPTVDKLPQFLWKHLRRFKGRLDGLAVGSRSVWKPSKRRAVKRALQGLAKRIIVLSDVEAAWMAAFTSQGIIVIAGTGSIAYGRTADGTFARAGGLGPDKGDEGSGYWIGREWLQRTGRIKDVRKSVRDIASLAPKILARAKRKDPIALEITRDAQKELATLVTELAKKLSWKGTIRISVSGSVLENAWFQRRFFRALVPLTVVHQRNKADAATALAKSIMNHAAG
jgi:glucosamine kinase